MSIGIGTLQPRARVGYRIWPILVLALFLAISIAAIATTRGGDTAGNQATVRGTQANTPTELRGGMPAFAPAHEPIVVNGNVCGQCR